MFSVINRSEAGGRGPGPATENFGAHRSAGDSLRHAKSNLRNHAAQALEQLHSELLDLPHSTATQAMRQTADAYIDRISAFAAAHRFSNAVQGREALTSMHRELTGSINTAKAAVERDLKAAEEGTPEHGRLTGVRNELIDFHGRVDAQHGELLDILRNTEAVHYIAAHDNGKVPLLHRPWVLATILSTAAFGTAFVVAALLMNKPPKQRLVIIRDRPPAAPTPPPSAPTPPPSAPASAAAPTAAPQHPHLGGGSPVVFIMPSPSQN